MRFYARCSEHSASLDVGPSYSLRYEYSVDGGWYKLHLDSFECPTAKSMGQDGLYVGMAGAQYICRQSWVLEPIDDTVISTKKPDQILVDKEEVRGIAQQLIGLANRLGALVKFKPTVNHR